MQDLKDQTMKRIENDIKHLIATDVYDLVYIKICDAIDDLVKKVEANFACGAVNAKPVTIKEFKEVNTLSAEEALQKLHEMAEGDKDHAGL